ncbi:hypothetical protein [Streptomyces sp. NPDC048442]|uniref:hypothetical protein n=1 Tax=Streptomyces sp. NPDC048442 TaxID=3154823 RepID=UPI003433E1A6
MKPARSTRRLWARTAALGLGAAVLVAGVIGARSLWYGAPYPPVDPDAVSRRLDQRSQDVYDHFGLPASTAATVEQERRDTGVCYYHGLQAFAHIDRPQPGVVTFGLDWSVPDISDAEARTAVERLRSHLVAEGWHLRYNRGGDGGGDGGGGGQGGGFVELGFVFDEFASDGDTDARGDGISVMWNSRNRALSVDVYSPCGKVPDSFDTLSWNQGPDWQPAAAGTAADTASGTG